MFFDVLILSAPKQITEWGRNGFDGDKRGIGCIPSSCQLVKMAGPKVIADDYEYALAA